MKSKDQNEKNNDIQLIIQKVENHQDITLVEEEQLKNFFRGARIEINLAKNINENSKNFSKRETLASQMIKHAGFRIVIGQLEALIKAIFQD